MTSRPENPIRILLVEDSEDDYLITRAMFDDMDGQYEVNWVRSYQEALDCIAGGHFDVYLFDYTLDKKNGLDLLREPTVVHSDVPAILMTGEREHDIDIEALHAGAADYLNKHQLDSRLLEHAIRYAIERAQTLRRLRQSEERYRAIVEDQSEFLIRFSPNGELTFCNESYCRHRENTQDALIGTSFIETLIEDDRRDILKAIRSLTPDNPTTTNEVQDVGGKHWHRWTTRAIFDDGKLVEYQSFGIEITEQKETENSLKENIERLRILRRVDEELTDTLKMDSVANLAIDTAMRLSGADIAVMCLYDESNDSLDVFRSIGIPPNVNYKIPFQQKTGVIADVLDSHRIAFIPNVKENDRATPTLPRTQSQIVIPLISQERLVGMISLETRRAERFDEDKIRFLEFITARIAVSLDNARLYDLMRKQYEELQTLYAQVTDLEQLKTDMIRMASHDLKNPIGIIQGYVEVMLWDLNDFDRKKFEAKLTAMEQAIQRMQKITTDILSLERVNELDGTQQYVDLGKIVRRAHEEYLTAAETKSQALKLNVPDSPVWVLATPTELDQATANLISNAIKYTPDGGTIEIVLEDDGDAATLEVIDDGIGIPEDKQTRLFQPFYRAKVEETRDIEGTGLGLHLVKKIIERHKGRMIFRSRYQEGSTFGFQLPTYTVDKVP